MTGLLDSKFMKVMLSGSPYMQERARRETQAMKSNAFAKEWSGLLGTADKQIPNAEGTTSYGLMDGEQQQPVFDVQQPGTGYLGGEMGTNEYQQRVALAHARQYPNQGMGSNIVTQGMANRGAMLRDQFKNSVLSANDMRNQRNTDRAYFTDQLATSNEVIKAGETLYNSMPKFSNGTVDVGSFNSSTDNQLIMSYAKAMNPGEAVATDERGNIVAASWMPEALQKAIAMVQGSAELTNEIRKQMLYQYDQILQVNQQENDALVQRARGNTQQYGGRVPFNRPGQNFNGGGQYIPGGNSRRINQSTGPNVNTDDINWGE